MAWTRSASETTALPIDALAVMVLRDYHDTQGWNWRSWMLEARRAGTGREPGVTQALSEAWAWLIARGLVARDFSQDSADAVQVSRLGHEVLQYGVAKLAAAERLSVDLHPRIAQRVHQQFLLGEFELAVHAALREVEIRVRDLSDSPSSLLGTSLMQQAFAPNGKGPLTDAAADGGEQVAAMELFKGAIGLFKNPVSHRPVDYDDPTMAGEIILLADLLLRLLDGVERRLRQT